MKGSSFNISSKEINNVYFDYKELPTLNEQQENSNFWNTPKIAINYHELHIEGLSKVCDVILNNGNDNG